jgi:hypothetical protein
MSDQKLKETYSYDPESGELERISGRLAGPINRRFSSRGYLVACFNQRMQFVHRLAWELHYGSPPSGQIDHVNGDKLDNRIENLRIATPLENGRNKRMNSTKVGAKGVFRARHRWRAHIYVVGKCVELGCFDTQDEAAHAYNRAAVRHFGDFACLNPVPVGAE